jgi:hypothetical protein
VKTLLDERTDEKGVRKGVIIFLEEMIGFTLVQGSDAFECQRPCLEKIIYPELRIDPDQKSAFLFPAMQPHDNGAFRIRRLTHAVGPA